MTGLPATKTVPPTLTDTEEIFQELFKRNDWTDYAPIILPTEQKVEAMLAGTKRKPTDAVSRNDMLPGARQCTVKNVAIAAVMAGASTFHVSGHPVCGRFRHAGLVFCFVYKCDIRRRPNAQRA